MKLLGVLDSHHILDILHNTDGGGIATRIGTDGARIGIADVVADMTVLHLLFQTVYGLGKLLDIGIILPKHPQHEAQGSLTADARKLGKLGNGLFQ